MGIAELFLVAVALSMDAFAVGLTNGMTDCRMRAGKVFLIAAFYGAFQFLMPLVGYFVSGAFSSVIGKIAPWLSFGLLAFIGGKMIFDGVKEMWEKRRGEGGRSAPGKKGLSPEKRVVCKPLSLGTLSAQALATSIDALAVGVTFLALQTSGGMPMNIWFSCLIIGGVTFCLSIGAVYLGKRVGDRLADKAEIAGGVVLVAIGVKILLESLF